MLTACYCGEQESSDKELSALAKRTLQLLNSAAPFDIDHVGAAVTAVLGAATDANWHTRVSALTFLQSLVYRYGYYLKIISIVVVFHLHYSVMCRSILF